MQEQRYVQNTPLRQSDPDARTDGNGMTRTDLLDTARLQTFPKASSRTSSATGRRLKFKVNETVIADSDNHRLGGQTFASAHSVR